MLDWEIEPDAEDPVPEIAACIIEDGFESDYAECFYDDDKFREYLDEKFDDQYNAISNNGENPEKWDAFLDEKMQTEDNRSDEFFNRYFDEYSQYVEDGVYEDQVRQRSPYYNYDD